MDSNEQIGSNLETNGSSSCKEIAFNESLILFLAMYFAELG